MIFGGLIPTENESLKEVDQDGNERESQNEKFNVTDCDQQLTLTKNSLILDVTIGSIKTGPELS